MKKYLLLVLSCISFSMSLSAKQVIQNGNIWGRIGTGFGEGFSQGYENSLRQQQELELLERERQIQMEILERQRQIQIEILKYQRQIK